MKTKTISMSETSNKEVWKPIKGYPNYEVSSFGNVRSIHYHLKNEVHFLHQYKTGSGYLQVRLYNNGTSRLFSVHRLVAQAFIDNPNKLQEVNHKNSVKTDNSLINLEWVSHSQNQLSKNTRRNREKLWRPVVQLTLDGKYINFFKSIEKASKESSVLYESIWKCCQGKTNSAGGYVWAYAGQNED